MTTVRGSRARAFTLVELLVVIAIIGILVAMLLPAVQSAREAARRMQCSNNLKQYGLALHNYHSAVNVFPIGSLRTFDTAHVDGTSTSHTSWIARSLPYLEQQALYDKIDFELMPGNTGANASLLAIELPFTRCPSDTRTTPTTGYAPTNYVVCIGNVNVPYKYEGVFGINSNTSIDDIRDGTSNTMMVSECVVNFPWAVRFASLSEYQNCLAGTSPDVAQNVNADPRGNSWLYAFRNQAWSYNTLFRPNDSLIDNHECELNTYHGTFAARSRHPGGVLVALGDGSVRFVSDSIALNTWQSLGSPRGGEVIDAGTF